MQYSTWDARQLVLHYEIFVVGMGMRNLEIL